MLFSAWMHFTDCGNDSLYSEQVTSSKLSLHLPDFSVVSSSPSNSGIGHVST